MACFWWMHSRRLGNGIAWEGKIFILLLITLRLNIAMSYKTTSICVCVFLKCEFSYHAAKAVINPKLDLFVSFSINLSLLSLYSTILKFDRRAHLQRADQFLFKCRKSTYHFIKH